MPDIAERQILVIGGCGFIGVNLIGELNRHSCTRITVLDNETVGLRAYLSDLSVERFLHGDMRERADLDAAMIGQEIVVVLAAQTNVIRSIEDPEADLDINVRGTVAVLEAARRHGINRVIVASSAAALGVQPPPMRESLAPRPASPYGASKAAVEAYCSAYYHSYGLKTLTLRFSNCYGPGSNNKSSVVAHLIKQILAGQPLTIYGDGAQTRDFIFVEDLCRALVMAMTVDGGPNTFGRPYQVATGTETSITQLVNQLYGLAQATGMTMSVTHAPSRPGEIVRNFADISDIQREFGFVPKIELDEGLRRTWDYFVGLSGTSA